MNETKRICSEYSDFLFFGRLILKQLLSRGYNYNKLRKILNMVSNIKRESLIFIKKKRKIFYIDRNEINFLNLKEIFISSFDQIKNSYNYLKNKKLKIIHNMQPNLAQLLVHGVKLNYKLFEYFRFFGCNINKCLICNFGNKDYYLKLNRCSSFRY